jgi:hypothetical protein
VAALLLRLPDRELCVPVSNPSDDRSPAAKAYQWSSRIMVTSLEMVLPGIAGYWIDQKLGTVFAFMAIGLGVGCTAGMWHLLHMISDENRRDQQVNKSNEISGK